MKTSTFILSTVLVASICPANAALMTTFDSNLEGWTASGGILLHVGTGGNPSGFLSLQDNAGTVMTVFAPAAYYGDLSSTLGGTLSFDAMNLNGAAANNNTAPRFGTVTISGPGGSASREFGGLGQPIPDDQWHSYSAALTPALWSGNLGLALADVTEIRVTLESNNNMSGEHNGFDSFAITSIPEPATSAFGAIMIAVASLQRNRRTRATIG